MLNFERIELFGFKSFPEKVKIDLLDGITAIVGPNGCGKSNVADSIKWVLGEQSAKTLRGTSMQDVIFNGTALRKQLSYCEVSLYFNNQNGLFPSKPHSEVVITRKLFRSGESEYLMNKQTCRRKDIIETLHECGVSNNGYTVIEQGKVTEIFSSKPEDRRSIFEEAVGIAKTKQDRKETISRLDRVDDNISRTDDILNERKKQLDPLERQAEKTRSHRRLTEQLRYHEVNTYVYKYETASDTKNSINIKIAGYEEAIASYKQDFERASQSREKHQKEREEADSKLKVINEKITEKAVINEQKISADRLANERISYFTSENDRNKKEIQDDEQKKSENLKNIDIYSKTIKDNELKKKKCSQRKHEIEGEMIRLGDEMRSKESNAYNAQSKVLESVENLATINMNMGALSSEQNVITSQQKDIVEKVNALVERYSYYEQELKAAKFDLSSKEDAVEENRERIKSLEGSIQSTNDFIEKLSNDIHSLNNKISVEETRLEFQKSIKNSYEGFGYTVKNLLKQSQTDGELKKRIKGTLANVITTEKKFECAIETVLGGTLQNIITENGEDAEYIINYLKRTNSGRVTILPIKSIKRRENNQEIQRAVKELGAFGTATDLVKYDKYYDNVVYYALGNTLIVDEIKNAGKIGAKYHYSFRIVTLEGDVVSQSGTYSGGSQKSGNDASLLSVERKLKEISETITKLKSDLSAKETNKETLLKQANEELGKLDEVNFNTSSLKQDIASLKEKVSSYTDILSKTKQEIDSNKDQIAVIVERLNQIQTEYTNIEVGNTELKKQKEDAAQSQKAEQEKKNALQAEKDKLIEEHQNVEKEIFALESEAQTAETNISRLTEENREIDEKNTKKSDLILRNEKIIENIKKDQEEKNLSSDELNELAELRNERDGFDARKVELDRLIAKDDSDRDGIQAQIDTVVAKKGDQEVKLANVDSDLQYMSEKIFTDYQLDYDSCKILKDDNYDIHTSRESISKLNDQIRRLGNINPTAIEEYDMLSESYNELLKQKEDLVKARDDLAGVVKDLTKDMDTKFADGFEQIRTNFSKVFKELFGGGKADLVIEESQTGDPLDAGIEIIAEPPGKKLQKISLLSGGEKALTAIAILFAILKLRPMPFVVLDEIEAPLDDTNVLRFANYLKNFSKETQFICITHKKITMEHADGLFGITMPEKGVSSVVSVKLSDAVKMEGVD